MKIKKMCELCFHEEICIKKNEYNDICRKVESSLSVKTPAAFNVSVSCDYFNPKTLIRKQR